MTRHQVRYRFVTYLLEVLLAILTLAALGVATDFTPEQLKTALENAGVHTVVKTQTFNGSKAEYLLVYGLNRVAKPAIYIFRDDSLASGRKGLQLVWRSGPLSQELAVVAAGMPYVEPMANHDVAVMLSGCMPHNCGGKLGAIVYSIDRQELFKVNYDSTSIPHLKYSSNALVEKNQDYKNLLDSMLREHSAEISPM